MDRYLIEGDGFTVEVSGSKIPTGAIVEAVIDATLGTGESVKVTRL